ncbi:hypothetical protein BBBOND_0303410 [Babesia bigemina]|uniref:Uncharacterized protein n=1 Tax=Babesia bigemina TaxID=5866 RepID=A0A061D8Y9_BABBI|nr:hypothetical protein BBBOND_0303410 [Babesia bigemina]CDR96437.1 hypothetical protein BBBOND_0303410 [Babesia bigemina]|eukprot:XP_012768623.1 hypothetical protein BBBOND_0303410 [Babesia bigemina]
MAKMWTAIFLMIASMFSTEFGAAKLPLRFGLHELGKFRPLRETFILVEHMSTEGGFLKANKPYLAPLPFVANAGKDDGEKHITPCWLVVGQKCAIGPPMMDLVEARMNLLRQIIRPSEHMPFTVSQINKLFYP